MRYIAIIGFGIVGGGIPDIISSRNEGIRSLLGDDVDIKYILDLREFPDSPYGDRVVHDIDVILNDKDVEVVAETMGGSHPAFEFSVKCMEHGKSVVTSNKEVVATFGDELLRCAEKNGVSYLFEASVGGGIPVLRSFLTSLSHEKFDSIRGILNGTTNYILTRMKNEGVDFRTVLADAQRLGYAEKDPTADIDGIDAKRKIIILAALASGVLVPEDEVYNETISNISAKDFEAAAAIGGTIKLVAECDLRSGMSLFVVPQIVMSDDALYGVNDVYNAISAGLCDTGDVMFYGKGAGRAATAGAVVSDIMAVLSGACLAERVPVFTKGSGRVQPYDSISSSWYVRVSEKDAGKVPAAFSDCRPLGENGFVLRNECMKHIKEVLPDAESVIKISD